MINQKIFIHWKSFTLIETLVAISVFILGVLSVFSYVQYSFKTIIRQQEVIIMQNLAQEAIEVVRNYRDNNYLNPNEDGTEKPYYTNLCNNLNEECKYNLSFDGQEYFLKPYEDIPLKLISQFGFPRYSYSNVIGTNTKFRRRIILKRTNDSEGREYIKVIVEVANNPDWHNKYVLEDRLYNWFGTGA